MATPVGDSYATQVGVIAAGRHVLAGRGILLGDSLTALTYQSTGARWGLALTGKHPLIGYNAGVTNNTLQDIINRVSADVVARSPRFVLLRAGTNSLGLSAATFEAQYRTLLDMLLGAGIFIFVHAIPPKSGISGEAIVALNGWLSGQCAADPAHLKYVDDSIDIGDVSYNYLPAYYIDGIHMSGAGAYAQGKRMAPVLLSRLANIDPLISEGDADPNQWVVNPFNTGTGGGGYYASGTIPTGWGVSCNGVSSNGANCSIIAADALDANQTPWLRVELVGGVSNGTTSISTGLVNPAIAANVATYKRIDAVIEARLVGLDMTKIESISLNVSDSGVLVMPPNKLPCAGGLGTISEHLVLRNSYARDEGVNGPVSPASHITNSLDMGISIGFNASFATSIGHIDIRRASARGLPS